MLGLVQILHLYHNNQKYVHYNNRRYERSPDRCPEICDNYATKYDFIHVIHQKNGGLSAARNSGIEWAVENSDSQWITFIDSDDWVHPEYLYSLLKANLENKTQISAGQICVTNKYEINTTESPNKRISVKRTEDVYTNEAFDPNSACSRLFYKKLFENIRFPVGTIILKTAKVLYTLHGM